MANVIRSQETWHNSSSGWSFVIKSATNHPSSSCWMHTWDNVAEKYSKWFWTLFMLLWDLNPTPLRSRAIALPTRAHHSINIYWVVDNSKNFFFYRVIKLSNCKRRCDPLFRLWVYLYFHLKKGIYIIRYRWFQTFLPFVLSMRIFYTC